FPQDVTDKQKQTVEKCAQAVLDARAKYPDSSLADLYDPLTMPPDLLKAHQKLDKAVDLCYRPQPFTCELNRIEYLFEQYEKLTAPLLPTTKPKCPRKSKKQT
ncbi:MAG: type IIL restriction-modification enzyme MmeI, partial [Synechocystis sp.]